MKTICTFAAIVIGVKAPINKEMKKTIYLILLCALLASTTGCKNSKGENGVSEGVHAAQSDHNLGMQFDMAGQMHAAELYYRKAYEALKNDPSRDWNCYADAGYRYACILWQRDNE